MAPEVVIAIIAGIASMCVAIISGYFSAKRQSAESYKSLDKSITALEIKVDLLWKTYVVDAVKASRSAGLVAAHSKVAPTDKWRDLLPANIKDRIDQGIKKYANFTQDPYDISIQVTKSMEDELLQFSLEQNINMKVIIGGIYVLAENYTNGL